MASTAFCTRNRFQGTLATVLIGALLAGACSSNDSAKPGDTASTTTTAVTTGATNLDGTNIAPTSTPSGRFGLKLSEGTSQAVPVEPVPVVPGTPFDRAAADAIFARLPAWSDDGSLGTDFKWPVETLPPPRTGATIDLQFPAPAVAVPPEVDNGPLEVLRFQPEGDVTVAPFVSITFNQPMVPLTTLGQLEAQAVPATITPEMPGRWQWIGTRTLRFDFQSEVIDRLPMATKYHVEIPAGTVSQTGGTLAAAVSWDFATPPVTVQGFQPEGESLPLEQIFVVGFDQRIDPAAVLATVTMNVGDAPVELRLATMAEIEADDATKAMVGAFPDSRSVAFRAVQPLPTNAALTISIGPGTPSAEGPLTAGAAATYHARTYAPLSVNGANCSWQPQCPPGSEIIVEFNNPLDATKFDPALVKIEPAIPNAIIGASGNVINIRGNTLGQTTYTVTVPAGLTDIFGQSLGVDTPKTVKIGSAPPSLKQFTQPLTTLDPLASGQTLTITSVNHEQLRLRIFAVTPADWNTYLAYIANAYNGNQNPPPLPTWRVISDTKIATGTKQDQVTETTLILDSALGGKPGHVVVLVETTEQYSNQSEEYWSNRPAITWAQSTAIGLDAVADADELLIWGTDLKTGTALSGLSVELVGSDQTVTTDDNGLVTAALTDTGITALVATQGSDTALLASGYYGENWRVNRLFDESRWYVFDDRQTYRPGETVSIKGWVRRLTTSTDSQIASIGDGVKVSYTVHDPQGNEIATGTAAVNLLGGFDLSFAIPAAANLGYASVDFNLSGAADLQNGNYQHGFQIQEFRRPEFEVNARVESAQPQLSQQPATVATAATYYSGGPLAAAPVTWTVTTAPGTYSPPNWSDFTFGEWTPWWYGNLGGDVGRGFSAVDYAYPIEECCFPPNADNSVETFQGTTDSSGNHYLQIDFQKPDGGFPDLPVTVTAQSSVQDVNRQTWSSTTNLLVHPGQFYVGLRSERTFVRQGEPLDIQAIVTDIDGAAVAGRAFDITASRLEWQFAAGVWAEVAVDVQTCHTTSATEEVTCSFDSTAGGTFTISSTIADDNGGKSRSQLTRWVSGGDAVPSRVVQQEELTIIPDKATYAPGESAELLVQAPFATGEGLATVSRNGITSTIRFQVAESAAILSVPLADTDVPNVDVAIEVVGATPRTADDGTAIAGAPPRPAFAAGSMTLSIPPASRTLDVTVTPAAENVAPGAATSVDVTVTDADDKPVADADLAVVVVDEAVLSLSGYTLADPLETFYSQIPSYLTTLYGRSTIVLANPADLAGDQQGSASTTAPASTDSAAAPTSAPAAELAAGAYAPADADNQKSANAVGGAPANTGIDVRSNFDALAVFAPSVTTDANGHATVDVPLPDNLTRYRVMVVVASGETQFGSGEANITARLPLMVRPSAPRFLNFGDVFELPVILQNQTDQPMEVDVALQTANLTNRGDPGKRVTVPANYRIEVRFPMSADRAGTARFRVAAVSGDNADAATVELPVYTPATAEAFATYGVIDDGAINQPLQAPEGVIPQFGGLEITTSSTSLQALTDAVLYITNYPYDSSDALASRILSIAALRDVLDAFDAAGLPAPAALNAAVTRDIAGLIALQNGDGGFGYWRLNTPSDPYNTIQATHALVMAKDSGYPVPQPSLDFALSYLRDIESYFPSTYGPEIRDTLSAYALNVRMLAGDRDTTKAQDLYSRRGDKLQLDAVAWLWPLIDDPATDAAIEKLFSNRAVETAGAANFSTSYGDDAYLILNSDRRTDGIVLDALILKRPNSDLIPKVVTGLLGNQVKGRWDNIQENSFILLALKRYFDTYESQTPDFVAKVWLGQQYAGEHAYVGRSTDRNRISIPTAQLIAAGDGDIVISKEGAGRLYYRLGLRYSPASLQLDPLDRGFVVDRTYEGVDDPADVTRDTDGTWHIKAGVRVRVRLSMVAESQRTHVALIDPLPAGLEILNPALAVTEAIPLDQQPVIDGGFQRSVWWGQWFDHQNMRDDRAEAFASLLPGGVYDYSYVARATTPGTFITPPTRAEEMYAPETFGRSHSDRVVIGTD